MYTHDIVQVFNILFIFLFSWEIIAMSENQDEKKNWIYAKNLQLQKYLMNSALWDKKINKRWHMPFAVDLTQTFQF